MYRGIVAAVMAVAVLSGAGVGWTQNFGTTLDSYLRLEWEAGPTRGGSPTISGYVYNGRGLPAENVRFLAEALDSSGQVVGKDVVYVNGQVPAFNRAYFEARVPAGGTTYRFTLYSVDWRSGGGS